MSHRIAAEMVSNFLSVRIFRVTKMICNIIYSIFIIGIVELNRELNICDFKYNENRKHIKYELQHS